MDFKAFRLASAALALTALGGIATGCNATVPTIISGATVTVEPNLETVDVQLNFGTSVQTDIGGAYDVDIAGVDYGQILVTPSAPNVPFSVGFSLNLNIINDQSLVSVTPVTDLPSGQPFPMPNLNRSLEQISLDTPINQNFNVYAYVDLAGRQWVGAAVVLNFLNTSVFPAGLTISQGFDDDSSGNAQIWGAFFGPKTDSNGTMTTPGGIAVFANAGELAGFPLATSSPSTPAAGASGSSGAPAVAMEMMKRVEAANPEASPTPAPTPAPAYSKSFSATQNYVYAGQNASYYGSHPSAQLDIGNAFIAAMKNGK